METLGLNNRVLKTLSQSSAKAAVDILGMRLSTTIKDKFVEIMITEIIKIDSYIIICLLLKPIKMLLAEHRFFQSAASFSYRLSVFLKVFSFALHLRHKV